MACVWGKPVDKVVILRFEISLPQVTQICLMKLSISLKILMRLGVVVGVVVFLFITLIIILSKLTKHLWTKQYCNNW